jgi:hypothetical protein
VVCRLAQLLQAPWEPGGFAGVQGCELCVAEQRPGIGLGWTHDVIDGLHVRGGSANLFVPSPREPIVFAAPSMIGHYVVSHGYALPAGFAEAVLACPEMGSAEYLLANAERGPTGPFWRDGMIWGLLKDRVGPLDSRCEPFIPLALETLRRAVATPAEQGAIHVATSAARVLQGIGLVARAAVADLEAAVRAFPDAEEIGVALQRLRDPFGDGDGVSSGP